MKFLSMYHSKGGQMGPAQQAEMGKLMAETIQAGTLVMTGSIMPVAKGGARVRIAGGEITLDGPFAETKELTGGFAILEAKSREDAIAMTARFLKIAGEGECELHQLSVPGEAS